MKNSPPESIYAVNNALYTPRCLPDGDALVLSLQCSKLDIELSNVMSWSNLGCVLADSYHKISKIACILMNVPCGITIGLLFALKRLKLFLLFILLWIAV